MKISQVLFSTLIISTASVATVTAEPTDLVDATNPEIIAEIIQEEGFAAEIIVEDDGFTLIASAIGDLEFYLYFGACDDAQQNCEMISFTTGFDFEEPQTQDLLGSWNRTSWSKAFLNLDGDPFLEFNVNMLHGVSRANFADTLNWYSQEIGDFADEIGWFEDEDE